MVALLMYTISSMDRNNIGFAFSGMGQDLGLSATFLGLASGVFFWGYMILQIPGSYIAARFSVKWYVATALVVWGTFALLTGFVQNGTQLLVLRFLLGFAEGGVWPATLVLLSRWFSLEERARANALWMLCVPIGAIYAAPLSGFILSVSTWRHMFVFEALPAIVWALVWIYFIYDEPRKARWLSSQEKASLAARVGGGQRELETPDRGFRDALSEALRNRNVLLLLAVNTLHNMGLYGFAFWLPTLVESLSGVGSFEVGLISALPWVGAAVGSLVFARSSDRTGETKRHVFVAFAGAAFFLLLSVIIGTSIPALAIAALVLFMTFEWSNQPVFFKVPATFLKGEVLGATMGLLTLGNIGGFFGPFVVGYLASQLGSPVPAMLFLAAAVFAAGVVMLFVRVGEAPRAPLGEPRGGIGEVRS
jgi:MFS family permease